jgi:hypothetical protein
MRIEFLKYLCISAVADHRFISSHGMNHNLEDGDFFPSQDYQTEPLHALFP